jgi:hypothetical protein
MLEWVVAGRWTWWLNMLEWVVAGVVRVAEVVLFVWRRTGEEQVWLDGGLGGTGWPEGVRDG